MVSFKIGNWNIILLARDRKVFDGEKKVNKLVFDSGTLIELYHEITDQYIGLHWYLHMPIITKHALPPRWWSRFN